MSSTNKVTLIGRVGKRDIRTTQAGTKVANLSIATSESWKDKATGEKREQTEWHNVVIFGQPAEYIGSYSGVGDLLYINGSLKTEKYTDNNGIEKYITKIYVKGFNHEALILSSKNKNTDNNMSSDIQVSSDDIDDAIPF